MFKLAVVIAFIAAAAASGIPAIPVVSQVISPVISPVVSSQRAVIPHIPRYGYGLGTSARYFDKADYGYGLGSYGAVKSVGFPYNNYYLNDGRVLGLGLGGLGYGLNGFGYGINGLGHGLNGLGYGLGGLRYGLGRYGYGSGHY